jgi:hypothetical protein
LNHPILKNNSNIVENLINVDDNIYQPFQNFFGIVIKTNLKAHSFIFIAIHESTNYTLPLILGVDMNGEAREFLRWITLGYITEYSFMDCVYWLVKIDYVSHLKLIGIHV